MADGKLSKPKIIVITGPTCTGKTYLGIQLAKKINGEIISADSRQFYKKLNIGTSKPTEEELKKVKHYFINSLNPDEDYNVSKYADDAEKIIDKITSEKKVPLVVGGSGLYIKALIDGIVETADKDEEYRIELLKIKAENGINKLYKMLGETDPLSASKMLPQNWKRVMRALEVIHITGKPIWKHHEQQKKKNKFFYKQFGLNWNREILYKRINDRVDRMIESGLVNEVNKLLDEAYSFDLNSLNTVGYKEIISYLKQEITLERAIELIKRNTRRYAKRQMTWFKKDTRIKWLDVNDINELEQITGKIILELK